MPAITIPVAEARAAVVAAFLRAGLDAHDASAVCEALLEAEMTGRQGHGVMRVPSLVDRVAAQGAALVSSGRIRIVRDVSSAAALDGHGALGYLVAQYATRIVTERLRALPIVAVGCRGASHAGAIGYYARQIADEGHYAIAMAHCCPLLAPHGSHRPVLGTNPIAFACPGPEHPFVADVSPSRITFGTVMRAMESGEPLPVGAAVDANGQPTCDPAAARQGAVLPIEGPKGAALAFLVQAIAGPLCGAAAIPEPGTDYGFFLLGIRLDAFGLAQHAHQGLAALAQAIRDSGAQCPGDRSAARRAHALAHGLDIEPAVWQRILENV